MRLKRILGGLGVIALAAVGTQLVNVQASSAHVPSANLTCTTWSIGATNYDGGTPHNTYSYSIDGAVAHTGTFGAAFSESGTFAANSGNHTLVGYVYQNGNPQATYSQTYNLGTTNCVTYLPIPAAPVPAPPTCAAAGSATIPSDTATVHWSLSGNVATATAKGAHKFTGGVHKVTFTENVLPKLDANTDGCATHVTATAPVFTNGDCDTAPSLTGATGGTGYTVAITGSAAFGQHVVVTFTAEPNYRLDGQTVYTFDYAAQPDCRTMVSPVNPAVTDATCDHSTGTVSGFAITPATTENIAYSVDGLVVTASATDGYKLGNLPTGWTAAEGSDTVATLTVVRGADPICLVDVSPVNPAVTQASCNHRTGVDFGFSVAPADTEGIVYTTEWDETGVVVTATATDGYELGTLPDGWTAAEGSDTVATYHATEDDPSCLIDVSPVNPTVTDATCDPTTGIDTGFAVIAPADTEFITYTVNELVVTATAQNGHNLGNLPTGWSMAEGSTTVATYTVTENDPSCSIDTTSTEPTFANDACESGVSTGSSITLPSSTGVDYLVDGTVTAAGTYAAADGSSVTVTAQAQAGYTLTGVTEWTHTFSLVPECLEVGGVHIVRPPAGHAPAHQPVSAATQPLASTGVPALSILLIGGIVTLLGAGMCIAATTRWGSRA